MASSIYARPLTADESERLDGYIRQGLDYQRKRAKVIKFSSQGYTSTEIVLMADMHPNNVRKWINKFNKFGLSIIEHHNKGKTPRQVFTKQDGDTIASVALSMPRDVGMKFSIWSLPKLKQYLIGKGIVKSISIETIRSILISRGIHLQKKMTLLQVTEPDSHKTKEDVLTLSNLPTINGTLICFDETGKISLKENQVASWSTEQIKARLNIKISGKAEIFATFNPTTQEVEIMLKD